jgi:hypothetical protein
MRTRPAILGLSAVVVVFAATSLASASVSTPSSDARPLCGGGKKKDKDGKGDKGDTSVLGLDSPSCGGGKKKDKDGKGDKGDTSETSAVAGG